MADLALQLANYRLTTANILYHLPDHPSLLQNFVWQTYDLAPDFPNLRRFLAFWEREIEGRIHSVEVAGARIVKASEFRYAQCELRLH
ncbi:MAG: Usg family protein [Rhodospirillaceae bacterium]|nr:Usg family protein [Rhodospirillaceae bacterium]